MVISTCKRGELKYVYSAHSDLLTSQVPPNRNDLVVLEFLSRIFKHSKLNIGKSVFFHILPCWGKSLSNEIEMITETQRTHHVNSGMRNSKGIRMFARLHHARDVFVVSFSFPETVLWGSCTRSHFIKI